MSADFLDVVAKQDMWSIGQMYCVYVNSYAVIAKFECMVAQLEVVIAEVGVVVDKDVNVSYLQLLNDCISDTGEAASLMASPT